MDYRKIYDAIIERAKAREKPNERLEVHHVVPRSLGGTDKLENLVALTIREHYVIRPEVAKTSYDGLCQRVKADSGRSQVP